MNCFWRTKIVCFTSFKDQYNPSKWKKSLKVQDFEVVNSAICAIFTLRQCKNLAAARWSDSPSEKFYFEIFSKTNAVSITFWLRYIHGKSLKEIDFPTQNVDSLSWLESTTLCWIWLYNFPLGLNTSDNARENEIRLHLYQSYKQDRIYRCGEFDHMSFHIHVSYCGTSVR